MFCPFCHKDTAIWKQSIEIKWDANDIDKGLAYEPYHCMNERCEGTRGFNIVFPVYTRMNDDVQAEDYKGRLIATAKMCGLIERKDNMWSSNLKRERLER